MNPEDDCPEGPGKRRRILADDSPSPAPPKSLRFFLPYYHKGRHEPNKVRNGRLVSYNRRLARRKEAYPAKMNQRRYMVNADGEGLDLTAEHMLRAAQRVDRALKDRETRFQDGDLAEYEARVQEELGLDLRAVRKDAAYKLPENLDWITDFYPEESHSVWDELDAEAVTAWREDPEFQEATFTDSEDPVKFEAEDPPSPQLIDLFGEEDEEEDEYPYLMDDGEIPRDINVKDDTDRRTRLRGQLHHYNQMCAAEDEDLEYSNPYLGPSDTGADGYPEEDAYDWDPLRDDRTTPFPLRSTTGRPVDVTEWRATVANSGELYHPGDFFIKLEEGLEPIDLFEEDDPNDFILDASGTAFEPSTLAIVRATLQPQPPHHLLEMKSLRTWEDSEEDGELASSAVRTWLGGTIQDAMDVEMDDGEEWDNGAEDMDFEEETGYIEDMDVDVHIGALEMDVNQEANRRDRLIKSWRQVGRPQAD